MTQETKFEIFLQESEAIIAQCENALELIEEQKISTEVLQFADFDSVRTTIEEMQSLVVHFYDDSDKFITDDNFVVLSIELYQNAKYSTEALEESITDTEILNCFSYIRKSIDEIRNLIRK